MDCYRICYKAIPLFVSSDEKFDDASVAQSLCGIALKGNRFWQERRESHGTIFSTGAERNAAGGGTACQGNAEAGVFRQTAGTLSYADYPPEEPPQEKTPSPQTGMPLLGNLAQFRPTGLLSGLDGDTMLILAMMVMLYKDGGWDGCDKKLLMALAYLLT
ncbi:MAG: hypothetical protein ACLR1R_01030 [Ruminococcus callidus]